MSGRGTGWRSDSFLQVVYLGQRFNSIASALHIRSYFTVPA